MARRASIRASDADRESVAEHLRRAAGEGRLRTEELESRIGSALAALTYGELDVLTADLPYRGPGRPRGWRPPRAVALLIAVPLAALAAAAALTVVAGLFAAWGVWLLVGWVVLGGARRRRLALRRAHAGHWPPSYGPLRAGRSAARRSIDFWV